MTTVFMAMIAATVLHVSPNGDDANPGTAERPMATAVRARDALREMKDRGRSEVVFTAGKYRVRETLALDERDSGTVWRGENSAVFDGGFEVRDFRKLCDADVFAIQQLSPVAFSNALVADVKAAGYREFELQCRYGGAVDPHLAKGTAATRRTPSGTVFERMTDLWFSDRPMDLAREPDSGYLRLDGVNNRDVSFVTDCKMKTKLARERELMVTGFWHWNYLDETAAVDSMTPDGTVVMDDCILKLMRLYSVMQKDQPYFFVNALCAMDRPDEWFLDRTEGKLYVYPLPKGHDPLGLYANPRYVLSEFKDDFVTATNAVDIVFENLAFEHGKRHGIVANDCRGVTVKGCRFERLGGRAAVLDHVWRAKVENCFIKYMGTAGVQLISGNRKTLESGGSVFRGNEISFTSQWRRTYSPGLDLDGVGTLVEGNRFSDLKSSAINMRGNDQLIYNNFIERCVLESDDQGALDTYGYVSFQGNRIVGNVWKDIGGEAHDGYVAGQAGVRLDDNISGVYIASNVFINASKGDFGAINVNGGRANVIEDNVFIDCRSKRDAAITIGRNCSPWWAHRCQKPQWQSTELWQEDMKSAPYQKYPMMREKDLLTVFKEDNAVRRNYVSGCRYVAQRSWGWPDRYYDNDHTSLGENFHAADCQTEYHLSGKDGKPLATVIFGKEGTVKIEK